jgi:hypothetical protein
MKIAKELAKVFADACKHVDTWEGWQRSLDPQGSETVKDEDRETKDETSVSEQRKLRRSA